MKRGRWLAVGVCSVVVGAAVGLLSLVIYRVVEEGGLLRFAPIAALVLLAAAPFAAATLSGHERPLAAGAGGLALAIGATVAAAALDQGGSGAFPLTMAVGVGGAIALAGPARTVWARLAVLAVLAIYSLTSERIISAVFAYPLFGIADEIVESFGGRRPQSRSERATTSQR
jgi:hypothetical protein